MESIEFKQEIEAIYKGEKHISFSALKAFLQSPKHFYNYKMNKETTKAMEQGKIFHMACLEYDKLMSKYWVLDDSEKIEEIGGAKPRSTKVYREWKEKQIQLNSGKEMISQEDLDLYTSMKDYLYQCSATKHLMEGLIHKEKPFEFEYDGFKVKGQIDGEGKDYCIDLKKCADASFKKIRWVIEDMMYDMQGAIYSHAVQKQDYYLIFIDPNINVTVVKIGKEKLQAGFNKFAVGVEQFRNCIEEDKFYCSYEFFNNGYINY